MIRVLQQLRYQTPLMLLLIAGVALAGAFISEYAFGLHPCILCLYQRIPYALVLVVSIVALMVTKHYNLIKPLLWLCAVLFIADAAIAFFHVGVEYKWWSGTEKCSGAVADSVAALRAAILGAPQVRCDEPQFEFGLTMAGWNVLYAMSAAAYCFYILRKPRNES